MIRTPISNANAHILMSRIGICDKSVRKGAKRVIVDGVVYPSCRLAAMSINEAPSSLNSALRKRTLFKGHSIQYCEDDNGREK